MNLDTSAIPLYVFDREGSQQSRNLVEHFQSSRYFDVVNSVDNYPALPRAIDEGRCRMGIVIPPDFSRKLNAGHSVGVQALVDAIDDNTANLAFSYSDIVIRGFSGDVQLDWEHRQGLAGFQYPLNVEARVWFNEQLESRAFIVPGVVALVMTVIGTFLTSLTIAREWERGTMEQLISTPVQPSEIMVETGAVFPDQRNRFHALCGDCRVGISRALPRELRHLNGQFCFIPGDCPGNGIPHFSNRENPIGCQSYCAVYRVSAGDLLSGFIYPIDGMPAVLRVFTHIIPARYYVSILKGVFLKGSSISLLRVIC